MTSNRRSMRRSLQTPCRIPVEVNLHKKRKCCCQKIHVMGTLTCVGSSNSVFFVQKITDSFYKNILKHTQFVPRWQLGICPGWDGDVQEERLPVAGHREGGERLGIAARQGPRPLGVEPRQPAAAAARARGDGRGGPLGLIKIPQRAPATKHTHMCFARCALPQGWHHTHNTQHKIHAQTQHTQHNYT